MLKAGDINVPKEAYQSQVNEMLQEIQAQEKTKERGDSKTAKVVDRLKRNIDTLKEEENLQNKEREKMNDFITNNKEKILANFNTEMLKMMPFL